MGIFTNPFFSIAGQKERLSNVVNTLNAAFNPFTKSAVQANVSNPTLKKSLELAANHPYIAAGIATAAVLPIATTGAAALAGGKALIPTVKAAASFAVKNPIKTLAAGIIIPPVLGAISQKPSLIVDIPTAGMNFGENIVKFTEEPTLENGLRIAKENPGWTAAALAAALGIMGYSASLIATIMNTRAMNKNTLAENNQSDNPSPLPAAPPILPAIPPAAIPPQ